MTELIVGIDIGGTATKFGLVDLHGKVHTHSHIPTDNPDAQAFVVELTTAIRRSVEEINEPTKLIGIGLGAPNASVKGTIEQAFNLPWKGTVPIAELLKAAFGLPISVTNDANAAAMGEMMFGGAKAMKDFVVITLGTGLGAGIVSNGQLLQGDNGHAGELGHVAYKKDGGRQCKCGRRGCLETYVSSTGLKRTVYELLADRTIDSELKYYSFDDLNTKIVAETAQRGDIVALEAFRYTGRILGKQLADIVAYTGPEAIFIMGGLAKANALIFDPTIKHFNENLLSVYEGSVKVLPSKLNSTHTPILGSAGLILNQLNH